MNIRRNPEPGSTAVLWLATVFVVVIGAGACAFIIVSSVEKPSEQLFFWGGVFGSVIMVLIVMAVRRDKALSYLWLSVWAATRRRSDPKQVLRIGRKKSQNQQYGNNAPPTLDSVRDAAENSTTWVPHGPSPDRSRPR